MNQYTLESFITFCDDMTIITESSKLSSTISSIWIGIRTAFKKILQFFKNLLMNINYFKTAQLPSQKSKDIITLVQNLTPRYDIMNKMFMLIYRVVSMEATQNNGKSYEKIYSDIDQTMDDVNEIISTAKTSPEYKRIEDDNYDEKTNSIVPLSNIITEMKKSQNDLIKYDANAQKMQIAETDATTEYGKKAAGKCRQLFISLCEIYRMKISLLKIFFEHAKVSMSAVGKNISEKKNKDYDPSRNYSSGKNFIEMLIKRGASIKRIKLTPEQENRLKELDKIVMDSKNDLSRYNDYYRAYTELCKMFGIGTNVVLVYGIPGQETGVLPKAKDGETVIMVMTEDPKPMKLLSNTQLFHTSSDGNLTELTGRFFHTSLGVRRLWNTPRVYFSIGHAIAKDGSKYNGVDPMARYEGSSSRSLYNYTPVNHISSVNRDVEMGTGSAVYVESTSPIKVIKV